MSGSPEVVRTVPVSAPLSRERDSAARLESASKPRAASAISKVGWAPQGELGQEEWLATGRRLGVIGRCSQWWIGDWIRYGNARWGERYAEAARVTKYDAASLRNMAWVASRFDLSLRNDKLTWSHHVLLAPLEADEQRRWIERAIAERLSVADLRGEMRAELGSGRSGGASPPEGAREGQPTVCPHCGHELPPASA